MLVQHPDGRRWGPLLGNAVLMTTFGVGPCMCGRPHPHREAVSFIDGNYVLYSWQRRLGDARERGLLVKWLADQEFDAQRPHEAIYMTEHRGYGFFYLPAEPAL